MKKTFYSLLTGVLLASCVANEPAMDENKEGNAAEVQGYLSINLVAPGGSGTVASRAGEADGDYEYGTTDENYVSTVRLYFFDDEGNAVAVRKNPAYENAVETPSEPEYFSYYDWDPTPGENADGQQGTGGDQFQGAGDGSTAGGTVEKILSVIVALTAKEAKFPTQVAAIINPTDEIKAITESNPMCPLSMLMGTETEEEGVFDNLTGLTDKNFVMSSSVYVQSTVGTDGSSTGNIIITQPIDQDLNLGYTQTEAQKNPINIFVERVVSRLDLTVKQENVAATETTPGLVYDAENDIYSTQTTVTTQDRVYDGETAPDGQLDQEQIYVKLLGWQVTATPTKSNVIKHINADWGGSMSLFGSVNQPWYITDYHRSYWATNPVLSVDPETGGDYVWYTFAELSGKDGQTTPSVTKIGFDMDETQTYMQENANPYNGDTAANPFEPTKVIIAAQLVDSDGNEISLAAWNDLYFTIPGLQNLAAKMLNMYYYDEDTEKYVGISGDQITFLTASQFENRPSIFPPFLPDTNNETRKSNYTVYATLTDEAAELTWYHLSDNIKLDDATEDDFIEINPEKIAQYMQTVFGHAQIWNHGYTYYYYTIRHLGAPENPGYYGVVRNHIYNGTVDGLKGLGTPVWDPNEKIYPEKPKDDGTNLSVKLNVLSWRLVTDSYEFEW